MSGSSSASHGALPFNKMFVMIPVMLAARKLNNEDPNTVFMLRIAYGVVQCLCVSIILYSYWVISSLVSGPKKSEFDRIIYVPAPAQPFADPNSTKKKYTEITLSAHLLSAARSIVGSTLFGIVMTCGLHYYKGMVMGLAIQAIMGPLNLWENVLVRSILLRGASVFSSPEARIFEEKLSMRELDAATDEVVDERGNPVVIRSAIGGSRNGTAAALTSSTTTTTSSSSSKSLEDVLLDTWDQGSQANLSELLSLLNADNINTRTKTDGWTPLMIVSGLKCDGDVAAIRLFVQDYKADIALTDNDGWTCLHWAAFHNSLGAATELYHHTELLSLRDNEGKTPLEIAEKEENVGIVELLQTVTNDTKKDK